MLRLFARRFEHRFIGDDHALGGLRTTLPTTRQWYARLYRLLPDISFEVQRIAVSGTPWNTIVVAEWTETNSGTDGVRTSNAACTWCISSGPHDAADHLSRYDRPQGDAEPAGRKR